MTNAPSDLQNWTAENISSSIYVNDIRNARKFLQQAWTRHAHTHSDVYAPIVADEIELLLAEVKRIAGIKAYAAMLAAA